jgi:predicted flap endonuclease-1-like 5' DNA nuclease
LALALKTYFMRKSIKSIPFSELILADIQGLKAAKKQAKEDKKQAKTIKNEENPSLTKDERQTLKLAFMRTKIRHKAAKAAYKVAQKILSPFLIKEIIEKKEVDKKEKTKHKADTNKSAKAAKSTKKGKTKITSTTAESKEIEKIEANNPMSPVEIVFIPKTITTTTTIKRVDTKSTTPDDLTLIEGIGPKIAKKRTPRLFSIYHLSVLEK